MLAKKSLGQNFLRNTEVVVDIVTAAKIIPGETVLEIGPGEGILTAALIAAGTKVTAVEKDDRLIADLETKFPNARIVHADILNLEPSELIPGAYKLVANIPYYITGELLQKFLAAENQPTLVVLMLQKEVAERIVAKDGKESILSISIKAYAEARILRYVPRSNFEPVPNVDSAVLVIEKISKNFFADIDETKFFETVKKGFANKRKMLGPKFGLADTRRAEELTLADWKRLMPKHD